MPPFREYVPKHAKPMLQSNMPIPKYPVLFYKPVTAVTGPFDKIPVCAAAQEGEGLDYECELIAVIGKEGTNIKESQALSHVAGRKRCLAS
jgi:2-keto-4-pentenoate hydratase/2-oxohepta-3-ene-1,7-dioic acid hydratase in catechol pathway